LRSNYLQGSYYDQDDILFSLCTINYNALPAVGAGIYIFATTGMSDSQFQTCYKRNQCGKPNENLIQPDTMFILGGYVFGYFRHRKIKTSNFGQDH